MIKVEIPEEEYLIDDDTNLKNRFGIVEDAILIIHYNGLQIHNKYFEKPGRYIPHNELGPAVKYTTGEWGWILEGEPYPNEEVWKEALFTRNFQKIIEE